MEILSSRVLLHPKDYTRTRRFYEQTLGLAVYREWSVGVVFFCGGGFLELSGVAADDRPNPTRLWLQVRDVAQEQARLVGRGVTVDRFAERMPWGLLECWFADPDGVEIHLVEVPPDHPLRSPRS